MIKRHRVLGCSSSPSARSSPRCGGDDDDADSESTATEATGRRLDRSARRHATAATTARRRRRHAPPRARRSRSPSGPSRPASTRTSSTTAASAPSTTTSTRRCSPARPTASWIPALATALPTQVDDTTWEFTLRDGVDVPRRHAVQRRLGRRQRRPHGRPRSPTEQTDNDGFYATLTGAESGRRLHGADHDRPAPTACCRRACTG